ncbi:MAG: 2-oxoacid:ferredoxin oxidoreductase subunit gamma [Dehalococcoidia bacterium]|nr:MAG: 2-oxoacid:ferredoxin oxidoreductase subunit gamma [Dehalococcoidia bacterium]
MSESRQVLLCGLGGQGVVLAGALLGAAGFQQGLQVSGTSKYGSAARGGECRSEVVLAEDSIAFPFVTKADVLVAFSQAAYDRYLSWTASPGGIVFFDDSSVHPDDSVAQRHVAIPATQVAETTLGTRVGANIVMLAAVVAATGLVTCEALTNAVCEGSPPRFRDLNAQAVELGFRLGREVAP